MQINGEIYKIGDTQKVSDRFSKREFILMTEKGSYPQHVKMEVTQDNCNKLNSYSVGDEVSVDFNIRGRLHNGANGEACFVTLQAWKLSAANNNTPKPNVQAENNAHVNNQNDNDDLPF